MKKNNGTQPGLFRNSVSSQMFSMRRRSFFRAAAAIGLLPFARFSTSAADIAGNGADRSLQDWVAEDDPHYWPWIRKQFSIPPGEAYFNSGTIGACPRQVISAVTESMGAMESAIAHYDYRPEHPEYIAGYRPQEALRKKAGGLINADGADIALTQNATVGINFVASGLDLKPGDEILITDQEHPGASGAWDLRAKRQGIVVKRLAIPIPLDNPETVLKIFSEAIGPRTKVIAVPHITSRQGIVMPVRELCQMAAAKEIFTLIDGAQSVGQLRVDVKAMGCDAYAASLHKWLLAPPGNGMLYVKPDRQKEIWATLASAQWNNYEPESGIFRLMQFGTANAALLAGLDAAIDFHLRIGPEKIQRRITGLADDLRKGLRAIKGVTISSPENPALAGAMVTYGIAGVAGLQLQDELWKRKNYRVRAQTETLVRQSVHIYNSPEEIEGTLEVARLLAGK